MERIILESLKFIEANINEPINIDEICKITGYSSFYFSRLFKKYMGTTIMEYVKQRKLIHASTDILQGMKIIDVTVKYGYDSHSGFSRAFKNEFGFSPALLKIIRYQTEYLDGGNYMSHAFMKNTDIHASKEELYNILIRTVKKNEGNNDLKEINKAYKFICEAYQGLQRYSGDDYVIHPLNVAIILAELEVDQNIILAGMMCDIFTKSKVSFDDVKIYTTEQAFLILEKLKNFGGDLRLATEEVILIKLAERLHNMRTIEFMDKNKWQQKAKETLDILLSLKIDINNQKLKTELNDLCLKYIAL